MPTLKRLRDGRLVQVPAGSKWVDHPTFEVVNPKPTAGPSESGSGSSRTKADTKSSKAPSSTSKTKGSSRSSRSKPRSRRRGASSKTSEPS